MGKQKMDKYDHVTSNNCCSSEDISFHGTMTHIISSVPPVNKVRKKMEIVPEPAEKIRGDS